MSLPAGNGAMMARATASTGRPHRGDPLGARRLMDVIVGAVTIVSGAALRAGAEASR